MKMMRLVPSSSMRRCQLDEDRKSWNDKSHSPERPAATAARLLSWVGGSSQSLKRNALQPKGITAQDMGEIGNASKQAADNGETSHENSPCHHLFCSLDPCVLDNPQRTYSCNDAES